MYGLYIKIEKKLILVIKILSLINKMCKLQNTSRQFILYFYTLSPSSWTPLPCLCFSSSQASFSTQAPCTHARKRGSIVSSISRAHIVDRSLRASYVSSVYCVFWCHQPCFSPRLPASGSLPNLLKLHAQFPMSSNHQWTPYCCCPSGAAAACCSFLWIGKTI